MRSALVVLAIAAALFVVAVVGGVAWEGRPAPERLRVALERRLSDGLGAPVSLPVLRLGFRGGIRLVTRGASLGPSAEGAGVHAEHLSATFDLIALLGGRLQLDRIQAEGVEVALGPGGGAAGPGALAERLPVLEALRDAAVRRVEILDARLVEVAADGERTLLLRELSATSERSRVRPALDLAIQGALPDGAAVSLSVELHGDDLDVDLVLGETDLAALPRPLRRLLPGASDTAEAESLVGPVGRLSGTLRLERREHRHDVELSVRGRGIAGRIPGAPPGPRGAFVLERPRLDARIHLTPGRVTLRAGRFSAGQIPFELSGHAQLPFEPDAELVARLEVADLSAERLQGLARRLPIPVSGLDTLLARIEAGRLDALSLALDSTRGGLEQMLRSDLLARPGEFRVQGSVSGARVALDAPARGAGPVRRLHGITGRLDYDGERLAIEGLEGRFDETPMPRLDLVVSGLANLRSFDEVRCLAPVASPATAGIPQLFRWLGSFRKEPRPPPSWHRLHLRVDALAHPAIPCAAEQLEGQVVPIEGGVDFELRRGVFAGLGIAGTGRVIVEGERSVRLDLSVRTPFEAQALRAPADPWGRGRFRWDATRIGDWHVRGADGRFRLSGSSLLLEDASLDLDPGGSLAARVRVDLADPAALQLEVGLEARDLGLRDLVASFRAKDPGRLFGRLHGSVHFEGPLVEGRSPLGTATGTLSLEVRDGWLARDLPLFAALLVADNPFEPIRGIEQIAFDRVALRATLGDGLLDASEVTLEGSSLRVAGTGRISVEPPLEIEAVIGLLLFPRVDSLMERVPILNRVILGAHGNLVGAYYNIDGELGAPRARLIPVRSLMRSGPASFVLEDVPGFLWGGVKRIHGILLSEGAQTPAAPPQETRADS